MKTDNRTVGGKFEQDLAVKLHECGFWVHVMQQNKAGQPADIIALKGSFHTLIDCKVISDNNGFPFDRVEENQRYAMRMFQRRANELCWFALRLPDASVWMIQMEKIECMKGRGKRKISEAEIRTATYPLDKWLVKYGEDT